jgi:hypothetical protein
VAVGVSVGDGVALFDTDADADGVVDGPAVGEEWAGEGDGRTVCECVGVGEGRGATRVLTGEGLGCGGAGWALAGG